MSLFYEPVLLQFLFLVATSILTDGEIGRRLSDGSV
jgi:hypothetical protein